LSTGVAIADSSSTSPATTDDPKSRIVCKEVQVTGSLLPGPRICHTRAEWEDIQRQSQGTLRDVQDNGSNTRPGQ
jgi:hypothetical protein